MTRINLVPPSELYDQHLIAEYREIRLLTQNLRRSFNGKKGIPPERIPKQFTLNTGHIRFFADKGLYISKRYQQLRQEMIKRGFTPQYESIDENVWPSHYFNDWEPSERDLEIIRERIAQKVSTKPEWYRYYGRKINT